jgi:hypothetical protein
MGKGALAGKYQRLLRLARPAAANAVRTFDNVRSRNAFKIERNILACPNVRQWRTSCGVAERPDAFIFGGKPLDVIFESNSTARRWHSRQIALIAPSILIALTLTACGPGKNAPAAPAVNVAANDARGPLALTTEQLSRAYQEDATAAQAKYGRRQLQVTGLVQAIILNDVNEPKVQFAHNVLAILSDKKDAAQLHAGMIRAVNCTDVSKVGPTPSLRNCTVKHSVMFGN